MRVLILSCSTGQGHNATADAIKQAFEQMGMACEVADSLCFASKNLSRFMSWGHVTMYRRIPGLFRFGYGYAEKHPGVMDGESVAYKLVTGGTSRLRDHIARGKYDTVICTHVFSGMLVTQMQKEHPMPLKTAFVATDYTCHPGTANMEMDRYFIASEQLVEEYVRQGIAREKLVSGGIPVRQEFYRQRCKTAAKRKAGIDPASTHLLMMCGSMGCGPMEELTQLLSRQMDEKMVLSVVCGTNKKRYRRLRKKFAAYPNIRIHGFVADIASMLDSADVYLTKPGGLSVTEAVAKKLPMVLVDAVAGCEEHNRRFLTEQGGAVTGQTPQQLAQQCLTLMTSADRRKEMSDRLGTVLPGNGAQRICQIMCTY